MKKQTISTKEAAEMLGCSMRTIQRMVQSGELYAWKLRPGLKSVYVFDRKDLEKLRGRAMAGPRPRAK